MAEGERCPGERKCRPFQSAAEPKIQACKLCPLLPTKPTVGSKRDEEFLDQVQRLIRRRDSGFDISNLATNLEYECILHWDDVVATYERQHQARTAVIFELLKVKFLQ